MFVLTLIYSDGRRWIAGGFSSEADAQAWVDQEKARPGADPSVQFQIAAAAGPAAPTSDDLWRALRAKRNADLSACDWTQLADCPLSDAAKLEWVAYRQALRDLPDQSGVDPACPFWPAPPASDIGKAAADAVAPAGE